MPEVRAPGMNGALFLEEPRLGNDGATAAALPFSLGTPPEREGRGTSEPALAPATPGTRRRWSESVPLLHLSEAQLKTLSPRRLSGSQGPSQIPPWAVPVRLGDEASDWSNTRANMTLTFAPCTDPEGSGLARSSLLLPPKSPARQPSWISSAERSGTSRSNGNDSAGGSLPPLALVPEEPKPPCPARVLLSVAQASTLSATGGFGGGTTGAFPALRRIISAPAYQTDAVGSPGAHGHDVLVLDRWSSRHAQPTVTALQVSCPLLRPMSLDMAVPVPRRRGSACGGADVSDGANRDHGTPTPPVDGGLRRHRPRSTSLDEPALVPTRQGSFRVGVLRPTLRRNLSRRGQASPRANSQHGYGHPGAGESGRSHRGLDTEVSDPETFLLPARWETSAGSSGSAIGFKSETCLAEIFIPITKNKISNRKTSKVSSATDPFETSRMRRISSLDGVHGAILTVHD